MFVSFKLHVHCTVCSKGTCFRGTFWSSISQMKNIEKGNLPVMKPTTEHVTDNCFRSHQFSSSFGGVGQAQGAGTSLSVIAFVSSWLEIPEFGYCLVFSLYQKITPQCRHILCTSWNLCKYVVCDICLFVLPASWYLSFFGTQSQSTFLFFFGRNLLQLQLSWTFYFTITQLLSCCWADRPKSCMSESVLGTGVMRHTVALGTAERKVQCPAEGGCCLIPVWRWGGGCWLMCRRASRR